jgi:hypothetical protein
VALRALVTTVAKLPRSPMPALRADEPLGPAQPLHIVQAISVGPEPGLKLAERAWIVLTGLGTGDLPMLLR